MWIILLVRNCERISMRGYVITVAFISAEVYKNCLWQFEIWDTVFEVNSRTFFDTVILGRLSH
jgi:hypothetical protein